MPLSLIVVSLLCDNARIGNCIIQKWGLAVSRNECLGTFRRREA